MSKETRQSRKLETATPKRRISKKRREEDQTIEAALAILSARLRKPGEALNGSETAATFLKLKLAEREHEVFLVLFLDNQNRVIEAKEMFRGTIDSASVYPREIVKEALSLNAAAVILAHNHPSGDPEPSIADESITETIRDTLNLVEVRTLDHIVIGGNKHISFTAKGWCKLGYPQINGDNPVTSKAQEIASNLEKKGEVSSEELNDLYLALSPKKKQWFKGLLQSYVEAPSNN